MPRQRKHRIYWKNGRAYADFRDYALWGGRQEALRAPESSAATSDATEALRLCTRRLDELEKAKAAHPTGIPTLEADPLDRIAPFVGYHLARLEKRIKRGRMLTAKEIGVRKSQLIHATTFLAKRGKHTLREITTGDVRAWLVEIEARPPKPLTERRGGRAGPLSEATRAKYLATLNGLLRRAWREERIAENPIDRLDPDERPSPGPSTTPFLEIPDAALALEVGRLFSFRGRSDMQHYVRMAMHLLTGGRGSEVEGLEKADLDFVDDQLAPASASGREPARSEVDVLAARQRRGARRLRSAVLPHAHAPELRAERRFHGRAHLDRKRVHGRAGGHVRGRRRALRQQPLHRAVADAPLQRDHLVRSQYARPPGHGGDRAR